MEDKLRFDFATTQKIINKISYIDSFKGKWLAIEKEENKYLRELRKIATIESIGSSTRIEGAALTNKEVATLLNDLQINKLKSRDEQEVIGYYEVLELILNHYKGLDLTEGNIFHLHSRLLKYSGKDQSHRGTYKQLSNKVVANYPGGEQRVIFNTTEPYLVRKEMEELLNWVNNQLTKRLIHPLIVVGTFVYEFLSIHPFQDGNGRLSRLLTTLLLLQEDYPFIQYVSFENQVEQNKKKYYQVLMDAQQHRGTEKEVINEWMLFFLGSLEILISKLEEKYTKYKLKGPYLNSRQKGIIEFVQENEQTKIGDIDDYLKSESRNTIKKDMQYLLREGLIDKIGKGKGTMYLMRPANNEED